MKRDPYRPEAPTLRWLWAITLTGLLLAALLAFDALDADASEAGCEVLYVKTDHQGVPYIEDDEQVTRWGPDVGAWVPHEVHAGYRWTRTDTERGECGTTTTLEPTTTTAPETTTSVPETTTTLPPVLPADPCSVWPEECADHEEPTPLPVPEKDPVTVEPERTAATLPVTGPSEDRDRRIQKLVDAGLLLLVVGIGLGFVAADNKRRRA